MNVEFSTDVNIERLSDGRGFSLSIDSVSLVDFADRLQNAITAVMATGLMPPLTMRREAK